MERQQQREEEEEEFGRQIEKRVRRFYEVYLPLPPSLNPTSSASGSDGLSHRQIKEQIISIVDDKVRRAMFAYGDGEGKQRRYLALLADLEAKFGPEPPPALFVSPSQQQEITCSFNEGAVQEDWSSSDSDNSSNADHTRRNDERATALPRTAITREELAAYRTRLLNIYLTHCPQRVLHVEDALIAYKGREGQMVADAVALYGAEPDHAAARRRLVRFYSYYCPEKLAEGAERDGNEAQLDLILSAFVGETEHLFDLLVERYGPEPVAATTRKTTATASSSQQQYEERETEEEESGFVDHAATTALRLRRFFAFYAPERLHTIPHVLQTIYGARTEEEGEKDEGDPWGSSSPLHVDGLNTHQLVSLLFEDLTREYGGPEPSDAELFMLSTETEGIEMEESYDEDDENRTVEDDLDLDGFEHSNLGLTRRSSGSGVTEDDDLTDLDGIYLPNVMTIAPSAAPRRKESQPGEDDDDEESDENEEEEVSLVPSLSSLWSCYESSLTNNELLERRDDLLQYFGQRQGQDSADGVSSPLLHFCNCYVLFELLIALQTGGTADLFVELRFVISSCGLLLGRHAAAQLQNQDNTEAATATTTNANFAIVREKSTFLNPNDIDFAHVVGLMASNGQQSQSADETTPRAEQLVQRLCRSNPGRFPHLSGLFSARDAQLRPLHRTSSSSAVPSSSSFPISMLEVLALFLLLREDEISREESSGRAAIEQCERGELLLGKAAQTAGEASSSSSAATPPPRSIKSQLLVLRTQQRLERSIAAEALVRERIGVVEGEAREMVEAQMAHGWWRRRAKACWRGETTAAAADPAAHEKNRTQGGCVGDNTSGVERGSLSPLWESRYEAAERLDRTFQQLLLADGAGEAADAENDDCSAAETTRRTRSQRHGTEGEEEADTVVATRWSRRARSSAVKRPPALLAVRRGQFAESTEGEAEAEGLQSDEKRPYPNGKKQKEEEEEEAKWLRDITSAEERAKRAEAVYKFVHLLESRQQPGAQNARRRQLLLLESGGEQIHREKSSDSKRTKMKRETTKSHIDISPPRRRQVDPLWVYHSTNSAEPEKEEDSSHHHHHTAISKHRVAEWMNTNKHPQFYHLFGEKINKSNEKRKTDATNRCEATKPKQPPWNTFCMKKTEPTEGSFLDTAEKHRKAGAQEKKKEQADDELTKPTAAAAASKSSSGGTATSRREKKKKKKDPSAMGDDSVQLEVDRIVRVWKAAASSSSLARPLSKGEGEATRREGRDRGNAAVVPRSPSLRRSKTSTSKSEAEVISSAAPPNKEGRDRNKREVNDKAKDEVGGRTIETAAATPQEKKKAKKSCGSKPKGFFSSPASLLLDQSRKNVPQSGSAAGWK